jgi:hypothetical protein
MIRRLPLPVRCPFISRVVILGGDVSLFHLRKRKSEKRGNYTRVRVLCWLNFTRREGIRTNPWRIRNGGAVACKKFWLSFSLSLSPATNCFPLASRLGDVPARSLSPSKLDEFVNLTFLSRIFSRYLIDPAILAVLMPRCRKWRYLRSSLYSPLASGINRNIYRIGIQRFPLLLVVGLNHGSFRCDMAAVSRHLLVLSRFSVATEAQQAIHDHAHWPRSLHMHCTYTSRYFRSKSSRLVFSSDSAVPHFNQNHPSPFS